jgi:hypothetical protein
MKLCARVIISYDIKNHKEYHKEYNYYVWHLRSGEPDNIKIYTRQGILYILE